MSQKHIIVVGAGAAGLLAAGRAAQKGVQVTLLERMRQTGRKIRISGKGRCNITNTAPIKTFIKHFGPGGKFLRPALTAFTPAEMLDLLHDQNLPTEEQRGGRVFPTSGKAPDVARALEAWVLSCGVKLVTGAHVRGLDITDDQITGLHYDLFSEHGKAGSGGQRGAHTLTADAIIVATGGKSYPTTGSTGDGYDFAAHAGHTIMKPMPALMPLKADGAPPVGAVDLTLRNVGASLWIDGKQAAKDLGEVAFCETGLGGALVLQFSNQARDAVDAGQTCELAIDLKPALERKKLDARLVRDLESPQCRYWTDLLTGLLPQALIPVALAACDVPGDQPAHMVKSQQRKRLLAWLKDWRFLITGYGSFNEAIVTAGGVDTREVDPRTLASKKTKGLYLAGEVLNVDADTGGFNLQGAFSTGWVAGESAARAVV